MIKFFFFADCSNDYLQDLVELLPVLQHDHVSLAALKHVMARLRAIGSIHPSRQGTNGEREGGRESKFNKIVKIFFLTLQT